MILRAYFISAISVHFFTGKASADFLNNTITSQLYMPEMPVRFRETVHNLYSFIDNSTFTNTLSNITENVENRYYNGTWGQITQQWWLARVNAIVSNYPGNKTVFEVDHGFLQKSVVARLEGSSKFENETVILGAHFDSINRKDLVNGSAPGADDNAAGCVVLLETLRILVESKLKFEKTVEFHWYAGEEEKLLGSGLIAKEYKSKGINALAMLNLDAVGYHVQGSNKIGVHTDGQTQLFELVTMLIDQYLDFGWTNLSCGFPCSDHASWNQFGYPAVSVGSAVFNPRIHTENDTMEEVSIQQTIEFVKLGIAFIVEIAEPENWV